MREEACWVVDMIAEVTLDWLGFGAELCGGVVICVVFVAGLGRAL